MNQRTNSSLDSPLAWRVCLISSLFVLYQFIQMNLMDTISGTLMALDHLNAERLGWLSSSYFYANLLFIIPAGIMLDRYFAKKLILISLLLSMIGSAGLLSPSHYIILLISRMLVGIGGAFSILAYMGLCLHWFSSKRFWLVGGFIGAIAMLGGALSQAPYEELLRLFGWQVTMSINILIGFVIFLLIYFFTKDNQTLSMHKQFRDVLRHFFATFKVLVKTKKAWPCALFAAFVSQPIFILGGLFGILYLHQIHHLSELTSSEITSLVFIGATLGALIHRYLSTRVSKKTYLMLINNVLTMILLISIGYAPIHSTALLAILFFLLGMSASAQTLSYTMIGDLNLSTVILTTAAFISLCGVAVTAIFEPLFGWLLDLSAPHLAEKMSYYTLLQYHHAFLVLIVASLVSMVCVVLLGIRD